MCTVFHFSSPLIFLSTYLSLSIRLFNVFCTKGLLFERGGGGQDRCLKKLGSKFIRTLSVFNITKNDRVYIYIYFDLFLYRCLYPSRYFVDPHFAATSSGIPSEKRFLRRPSRSSSLFSRPGTFRGAHSSLSPSPPISSRFSRFFNVVALSPSCFSSARRSRCHPPRPPREEKKRVWNPAGIVNAPPLAEDSSPPVKPPNIGR